MAITLGSNIASLMAQRRLGESTDAIARVSERLASGQRINRASDDAAGLAVASSLSLNTRVLTQAIRNANDGISMLSVADGGLASLSDVVTRIQELATQAANGTYSSRQRTALNTEAQALVNEYNRISETTKFNGVSLLGSNAGSMSLQVGTTGDANSRIAINLTNDLSAGDPVATGTGTFQSAVSTTTALFLPAPLILSDYNEDGILDLGMLAYGSAFGIGLGNGNGTFKVMISYQTGGAGQGRNYGDTGDFNNDGHVDLAIPNEDGTIGVLLGNGNGTFKNPLMSGIATISGDVVASVGDFNKDGNQDIFAGTAVLLGNGNGTFKSVQTLAASGGGSAVSDLDGDGNLDIVGVNGSNNYVYLGNSSGTFSAPVLYNTAAGGTTRTVVLGDLNGDGFDDLLNLSLSNPVLSVRLSNGNGTFKSATSYSGVAASFDSQFALADLNGDGALDVVSSDGNARVDVLLGNGNGSFKAVVYNTNHAATASVGVGDINGDGVPDIVAGSAGPFSVFIADTTTSVAPLTVDLTTQSAARSALTTTQGLLEDISAFRGTIGSYMSRLSIAVDNNSAARENTQAAASRITDADVAQEAAELIRRQILVQTGAAILAQANQSPALALSLLSG